MRGNREPEIGDAPLARFLIGAAGHTRWLYAAAMVAWTSIYALPLVVGAVISMLIDRAHHRPIGHEVWWLLAATVGLMALRALILLIGLQLTFTLIFRTSAWLKVQVLGRLLGRPTGHGPARGNGEVLNRLRDDTDEIGGLLEWTTDLIYRSVLSIVAVAVLAASDPVMTAPLLLLLGGLLASVVLKGRVAALQAETRVRQGRIGAIITDLLSGIRDLRLSGVVDGRLEVLERRFTERRRVQVHHQIFADLLSDLFRNLVMIGTAVVLVTMSLSTVGGHFSVGKLALFLTYAAWLGQQMYFFGKIVARYQGGKVSYARLSELTTGERVAQAAAADPPEPLHELTVHELTCAAPRGVVPPAPVSFSVRPGQLVAITGELGSGKSTVIRSLLALHPDVKGSVRWNGVDITGQGMRLRIPRVCYARQSPRFLRGTVGDNLVLGATQTTRERIDEVMAAVQLQPGSVELPEGLDTRLDSGDASQLSGGQRQRLALARMLCRPAQVYVVDDCDSSIDGPTARVIWQTLPRRWPGAWIVVSHNADLLEVADAVVTMRRS
jgi:ATP-binding cassette, subfamily B, bacterial